MDIETTKSSNSSSIERNDSADNKSDFSKHLLLADNSRKDQSSSGNGRNSEQQTQQSSSNNERAAIKAGYDTWHKIVGYSSPNLNHITRDIEKNMDQPATRDQYVRTLIQRNNSSLLDDQAYLRNGLSHAAFNDRTSLQLSNSINRLYNDGQVSASQLADLVDGKLPRELPAIDGLRREVVNQRLMNVLNNTDNPALMSDVAQELSHRADSIGKMGEGQIRSFSSLSDKEQRVFSQEARAETVDNARALTVFAMEKNKESPLAKQLRRETEHLIDQARDYKEGEFVPGLGIKTGPDTVQRSPVMKKNERGKIQALEFMVPQTGGSISVYAGAGIGGWERLTDVNAERSKSHTLVGAAGIGRLSGGSADERQARFSKGLRFPRHNSEEGALTTLIKKTFNTAIEKNTPEGTEPSRKFSTSPATTVSLESYKRGNNSGVRISIMNNPELEIAINPKEMDKAVNMLQHSVYEGYRWYVANNPLGRRGEMAEQHGENSFVKEVRKVTSLIPALENVIAPMNGEEGGVRGGGTKNYQRLGISPTESIDIYIEAKPLSENENQSLYQKAKDMFTESPHAEADKNFLQKMLAPAGVDEKTIDVIADRIPFDNLSNMKFEVAINKSLSVYQFTSDRITSERLDELHIPDFLRSKHNKGDLKLGNSVFNNAQGATITASAQIVYTPPENMTFDEVRDTMRHNAEGNPDYKYEVEFVK